MENKEKDAINNLKERIKVSWEETGKKLRNNIKRGHRRAISTDVEDSIAIFISDLLDSKYSIYIDATVTVVGETAENGKKRKF